MAGKVVVTALKIVAVCLLFAVCFIAGTVLSGLDKASQQVSLSTTNPQTPTGPNLHAPSGQPVTSAAPEAPANQTPSQMPDTLLYPLLIFSVSVGVVLAYLILRSSWHGWPLVGAIFVGMYGISTVATQIETLYFLSNKMPHGMIRAIFLQGAITTALFAPLAVLLLGKWRTSSPPPPTSSPGRLHASSLTSRLAVSFATGLVVIVVAFVFLYMFFGYYVAWQNPALRQYYGGLEQSNFFAALKANWVNNPGIYALQVFRALLYAACMYPLIRMLRVARWETALAMALFLSVWTTILLLPNPLMPPEVAATHFRETLGFSIIFGGIAGWLLGKAPNPVGSVPGS
jgi:hypothetical protein